jgi:putative flippase GtrA
VDDGVVPAPLTVGSRYAAVGGEMLRFCAVGAVSYGLGITLAALFHEIAGLSQEIAVAVSLAIVLGTNFFLARAFIFRSSGRMGGELMRFVATSATMRGFEYLAFLGLLNGAGMNYLVALTTALVLSTCLKFVLYKKLVFRRPARGA